MTVNANPDISQNRTGLLKRLSDASDGGTVLVAASKRQPDDRVNAALAAGQRVFGENRVQEAQQRWAERRKTYPDLELRLIGPLQTNKAEDAVRLFDVIETIDRSKLANAIAKAAAKVGRSPDVLVQVNTGDEPQKGGVSVDGLDDLVFETRSLGLNLKGLMCIPPADEPPGPHFALLKRLVEAHDLDQCSMGMSGDFETAARFGATHVRIGTALFGTRPAS